MDQSPLNHLPGEIRNAIYKFAITCSEPIVLIRTRHQGRPLVRQCHTHYRRYPHLLALSATCRRTYHETAKMFYSVNTFRCNPYPRGLGGPLFSDVLGPWRKQLGGEKFALCQIVLWHWFSDGYLCGPWRPEFKRVICGMWDYAVDVFGKEGLEGVRFEIILPKKMWPESLVIDGKDLCGSWVKVLSRLQGWTRDLKEQDMWMRGAYKQLIESSECMLRSGENVRGKQ